jgi:hypothetical protein
MPCWPLQPRAPGFNNQDAPPPPANDSPAPLVGDEVMQPVPHIQAVDIPLHADGAAWLEEQCQLQVYQ